MRNMIDPGASEWISSGYLERSVPGGVLYDPASIAGAVAGPLVGGLLGSNASSNAADAQGKAAALSDKTQHDFYNQTRADNEPFRQNGVAASNALAYRLGLAPNPTGGAQAVNNSNSAQLRAQLLPQFTTQTAVTPTYDPNSNYEKGIGYANGIQIPTGFTGGGTTVDENGLSAAIAAQQGPQAQQTTTMGAGGDPNYGSLMRRFSASDLNSDPVYQSGLQFGLDQGQDGINRQAAASGSMLSGATLKALTRFGNDYGSTKAGDSYNRYNTDQTNQYNRLAGVAGSGQTATNQVGYAGTQAANSISQSQQGAGNAQASGYVGSANALSGGIAGGYNNYQNGQLLNRLIPQTASGYSGSTGYSNGADPLGSFIANRGF
jgi:hypothetical protein